MLQAPRIEFYSVNPRKQLHVDGELPPNSNSAFEFIKQGYLPRHYFPHETVRMDLLTTSETLMHCSFKGRKFYFSLGVIKDTAWSYEQPIEGIDAIVWKAALAGKGARGSV